MNRILIALAAAIFAVGAMFTPTAQAGFKSKIGIGLLAVGAMHAMSKQHRYERKRAKQRQRARQRARQRQRQRQKNYATKKNSAKQAPKVAKVAAPIPEVPVQKTALNENSSITTAALPAPEETAPEKTVETPEKESGVEVAAETTETAPVEEPKAPQRLDCKKFFPTVGMTLSVPCE